MEHTCKVEMSNQSLQSERDSYKIQLDSWAEEMAELRRKQSMFQEGQSDRLELNVKIDDLDRRLRKKIDDHKRLEQKFMSSETENEIVKREIAQQTAALEELKRKNEDLITANSSCYNRMMDYSE